MPLLRGKRLAECITDADAKNAADALKMAMATVDAGSFLPRSKRKTPERFWRIMADQAKSRSSKTSFGEETRWIAVNIAALDPARNERKEIFPMPRILILATLIVGIGFPVCAQQGPDFPSQNSQKGSAFPSPGSARGPAFPKSVSPTESNPTNWAKPPTQPDPTYGWDPRATYWYNRARRWR